MKRAAACRRDPAQSGPKGGGHGRWQSGAGDLESGSGSRESGPRIGGRTSQSGQPSSTGFQGPQALAQARNRSPTLDSRRSRRYFGNSAAASHRQAAPGGHRACKTRGPRNSRLAAVLQRARPAEIDVSSRRGEPTGSDRVRGSRFGANLKNLFEIVFLGLNLRV